LHEKLQPSCTFTKGADAVEPRVGADAADRADVPATASGVSSLLRLTTTTFSGRPAKPSASRLATTAGDVDMSMCPSRSRRCVTRLTHRFVRDAAGIDDRHVGVAATLRVTVGEQALTDLLRVDVRDLAAEKADREGRHGAGLYSSRRNRSAAQPPSVTRRSRRKPAGAGASRSR
jgi:hypothetical protein